MSPRIYYLIARNKDTNEKIRVELTNKEENRYNSTLLYIDRLTTKFVNKEQLIKRLYDNNYINFMNADIYIEYNHNGLRFEEVIFNNMAPLTQISTTSESTLDINDNDFENAVNNYIDELNKRNVRNYVLNSPKINLKTKEHIDNYFKNQFVREGKFFKQKIKEDLSNYKTFRDLKFVIDEINNINYKNQIDSMINERLNSKLIDFKPVKDEQLEFKINNNEVNLPNPNQVVSNEVLNQVVKEHNEEKEEFLTEDDWNNNYYPNNIKK